MRRPVALAALALAASACGGGGAKPPAASRTPKPTATATAGRVAIAPADQAACAALYQRLQRVTVALGSSSSLIAQSVDTHDLSSRIATQQQQLERSARLMDSAVVPAPLAGANRRLVGALRVFARDFARARAPAKRGDFRAAVAAMTDQAAVDRIVASATTIQDACDGR